MSASIKIYNNQNSSSIVNNTTTNANCKISSNSKQNHNILKGNIITRKVIQQEDPYVFTESVPTTPPILFNTQVECLKKSVKSTEPDRVVSNDTVNTITSPSKLSSPSKLTKATSLNATNSNSANADNHSESEDLSEIPVNVIYRMSVAPQTNENSSNKLQNETDATLQPPQIIQNAPPSSSNTTQSKTNVNKKLSIPASKQLAKQQQQQQIDTSSIPQQQYNATKTTNILALNSSQHRMTNQADESTFERDRITVYRHQLRRQAMQLLSIRSLQKLPLQVAKRRLLCVDRLLKKYQQTEQNGKELPANVKRCCVNGCDAYTLEMASHCQQHIVCNAAQHVFLPCTAKFADNTQCRVPVFDITHDLPLCTEHARKRDAYNRLLYEQRPRKISTNPLLMNELTPNNQASTNSNAELFPSGILIKTQNNQHKQKQQHHQQHLFQQFAANSNKRPVSVNQQARKRKMAIGLTANPVVDHKSVQRSLQKNLLAH
ncbi:INO80 complex subunit D [Eumeta japonica]|uniref:INO80 complex subunit D n=1 Tax=Eumeta variegata TaxID=151549 RepID=A0A4C2AA67_EUMVA|nr:INO80 complex subunit D [Eumeta japonica]